MVRKDFYFILRKMRFCFFRNKSFRFHVGKSIRNQEDYSKIFGSKLFVLRKIKLLFGMVGADRGGVGWMQSGCPVGG